jgi:hypothetical protein
MIISLNFKSNLINSNNPQPRNVVANIFLKNACYSREALTNAVYWAQENEKT